MNPGMLKKAQMLESTADLSEADILLAGAVGFAWVKTELEDWPRNCCFDTCVSIREELEKNLPEWKFYTRNGYYIRDLENEDFEAHVWLAAKRRGRQHFSDPFTIIDPTIGQYLIGIKVGIFGEGDKEQWRYVIGKHNAVEKRMAELSFGINRAGSSPSQHAESVPGLSSRCY